MSLELDESTLAGMLDKCEENGRLPVRFHVAHDIFVYILVKMGLPSNLFNVAVKFRGVRLTVNTNVPEGGIMLETRPDPNRAELVVDDAGEEVPYDELIPKRNGRPTPTDIMFEAMKEADDITRIAVVVQRRGNDQPMVYTNCTRAEVIGYLNLAQMYVMQG